MGCIAKNHARSSRKKHHFAKKQHDFLLMWELYEKIHHLHPEKVKKMGCKR